MSSPDPEPARDDAPSPTGPPAAMRYTAEEQLASGGQGVVFRGRDRHRGERVILKQLRRDLIADPTSVARFLREAEALRQLNHPNITRMLATFENEDGPVIVMAYLPGETLRQLMDREGPLPLPKTLALTLELADALSRAHHLDILHRDIKPENVLLTASGAPCLTDFGIAQLLGDDARLTRTGDVPGSPAYMSPEALRGETLDKRSDIWSFGVLLYELIAGQRPFTGATMTAVMLKILQEPAPDLAVVQPKCPEALASLVTAMLAKDREQRPPGMRLIASALEAIRDGKPPPLGTTPVGAPASLPAPVAPPLARISITDRVSTQSIPFVGREQELGELTALLRDPDVRLLTILGPGGVGKTQLAVQAGRAVQHAFRDGATFVPLAPLSSIDEIVPAIAESLDLPFLQPSTMKQQLLDHLQRQELLLILDNFEHLLDGVPLIASIAQDAPRVTVLVTSRASLNLSFEHIYPIHGLPFPPANGVDGEDLAGYPAVQLLLQQAHQVRSDLRIGHGQTREAARIARLVQGMPLALVLAARWVELLPLEEIAGEIARSLDFLDTTLRDLPPRQRSMRAVFDYSWQQLAPGVQQIFARLSVFRGGFTREAAAQVANAGLRDLLELARKSMVTGARHNRYEIHELLRQYGEEKLEASDQARSVCDAHSTYYLQFLGQREQDVKGRRQAEALREIEADMQNVRRAWNWALRHDDLQAIDNALETLHLFCDIRGRHQEAIELFARAREKFRPPPGQEPDRLWGRIVTRHGFLHVLIPADPQLVEAELQQGLAIARQRKDAYEIAIAEQALSTFASVVLQDLERSIEHARRAYDLFQELGDPFFLARALVNLGLASGAGSDPVAFARYVEEAVQVARDGGDIVDVALGLGNLTEFAVGMGQYATARDYCTEAITLARENGSAPILAYCQAWLACIDLLHGKVDAAATTLKASLALAEHVHSLTAMAYASGLLGLASALRGDHQTAQRLAREALANPANNTLGLILAPWALAIASYGLHQQQEARGALQEALAQAQVLTFSAPPLWLLPVAALFLADENQDERAVELLALTFTHPLNLDGWTRQWPSLRDLPARLRGDLDAETYQAAWQRGEKSDVSDAVAQLVGNLI